MSLLACLCSLLLVLNQGWKRRPRSGLPKCSTTSPSQTTMASRMPSRYVRVCADQVNYFSPISSLSSSCSSSSLLRTHTHTHSLTHTHTHSQEPGTPETRQSWRESVCITPQTSAVFEKRKPSQIALHSPGAAGGGQKVCYCFCFFFSQLSSLLLLAWTNFVDGS